MPRHDDPGSVLAVHTGQVVQEPRQLLRAERRPALPGSCQCSQQPLSCLNQK